MAILELNKFLAKIKSGDVAGRYIFAGEEEFLIRHYLRELSRYVVADDGFSAFNHVVFDGGEIDFARLSDAIEAPPMFSEYKLVEWRYADFSKMHEEELSALEELCAHHEDYPHTVLAISAIPGSVNFGTGKKAGKLVDRLSGFDFLRFERSSDKQLYSWLERHFAASGLKLSLSAAMAMVKTVGHSMDTLKGEVDKLSAYVLSHGGREISIDDVKEVCPSIPENDTFAFSNALCERNRAKAFLALEEMRAQRVEPVVIFSMISRAYTELLDIMLLLKDGKSREDISKILEMNIYKVGIYVNNSKKHTTEHLCRVVAALSAADAGMKSGGITGYTAVELFLSQYI